MSLFSQLQEKMNNVRIYGEYFMASCVWHGTDEHPSLMVRENGFRCLSCGKHGTLEYLDRYLGGHNVKISAAKSVVLPQWRKWEQQWGNLEGIARHAHESCKLYPQWMFYFKERKIDEFFELGYFGWIDNWCLFPVFNEKKKIVSVVLRYTGKNKNTTRYVTHQSIDGKQYLYVPNYDRVNDSDYVVLCYGIVDAWSFEDIGIPAMTGCTGKFSSAELLTPLHKKIYIVPDLGEERDAHKLANSLGWRGKVLNLPFPDGCKDADEIRITYGKDTLLSMLEEKINETN